MKKILSIFLVALMIFTSIPSFAAPATYPLNVTFVVDGQEKVVTFSDASDVLGSQGQAADGGGYLDKWYFIGWSTDANYEMNDDSKLFYTRQTVGELVEGLGIEDGDTVKLYPIKFTGLNARNYINPAYNKLTLNEGYNAAQTLPNANIKTDDVATNKEVVAYYEAGKDFEGGFNANFELNKMLAHWLYVGNGYSIMTNTQGDEGSSAVGAKYTHIDLHIDLPAEVEVADELELSFSSYYFQPYMMLLNGSREKLEVVGAEDGWNMAPLASNTDPKTTFTVKNPTKAKDLVLRVIVRTNWYGKGKGIAGVDAQTIEDSKMVLKLEDSSKVFIPNVSALSLADTGNKAQISGYIDGFLKMPATSFIDFSVKMPVTSADKPVSISFVHPQTTSGMYIAIDHADKVATKTDDGKAIFHLGLKARNQYHNLVYKVYSDSAKTTEITSNTEVQWEITPVAGFEGIAPVEAAAKETLEHKTTSTYVVGQTNTNKASAVKSGVYKVTAKLSNGESDYAYVVVPGDVNRNGEIDTNDMLRIKLYIDKKDINRLSIVDDFTLLLADVNRNQEVDISDIIVLNQMLAKKIASN